MESNSHIKLIISLSSLLFFYSAQAICMPRNVTSPVHSSHLNSPAQPQPVHFPPPVLNPPPPQPVSSNPPVSSSPSKPTPNIAIKTICISTDHPELCMSSILPYLTSKIDPVAVLEMEIKACFHSVQAAFATAMTIAADPSTPSDTAADIDVCKESYSDALDNLQSATDAIPTHDMGTLNIMLSAALTDFETCKDAFVETPGVNSPFSKFDDLLSKLASNCLAIASLIN